MQLDIFVWHGAQTLTRVYDTDTKEIRKISKI